MFENSATALCGTTGRTYTSTNRHINSQMTILMSLITDWPQILVHGVSEPENGILECIFSLMSTVTLNFTDLHACARLCSKVVHLHGVPLHTTFPSRVYAIVRYLSSCAIRSGWADKRREFSCWLPFTSASQVSSEFVVFLAPMWSVRIWGNTPSFPTIGVQRHKLQKTICCDSPRKSIMQGVPRSRIHVGKCPVMSHQLSKASWCIFLTPPAWKIRTLKPNASWLPCWTQLASSWHRMGAEDQSSGWHPMDNAKQSQTQPVGVYGIIRFCFENMVSQNPVVYISIFSKCHFGQIYFIFRHPIGASSSIYFKTVQLVRARSVQLNNIISMDRYRSVYLTN